MLFEICSGGKGLTALIANERFFVFVDFLVSIQVWLLIETLWTVLIITWVRLFASMDDAMADKARLKIKGFLTIVIGTLINFWVRMFISIAIIKVKLIIFLSLHFRMAASYDSIIHAIACEAEVLLRLFFRSIVEIVAGKGVGLDILLILIMTVVWKDVGFLKKFLLRLRIVRILIWMFPVKIKRTFVGLEVHFFGVLLLPYKKSISLIHYNTLEIMSFMKLAIHLLFKSINKDC